MSFEKKVNVIAWIPLQIVTFVVVNALYSQLTNYLSLYSKRYWGGECGTYYYTYNTLHSQFLIQIILFTVVGWFITFRIDYNDRNFWKSYLFLYMGCHLACLAIVLIYPALWCDAIAGSIFPIISMLELIIVNVIARRVKKQVFRISEKRSEE